MFKFNRSLFIVLNFIFTVLIFILLYFLRYTPLIDVFFANKSLITLEKILWIFLYSFLLIFFNVSLKNYEINKIIKLKESFISSYISSLFTISIVSVFFYILKIDFARFVLISGLFFAPAINSFFNKSLFIFLNKRKNPISIHFIGSNEALNELLSLVTKFNKYFSIEVINDIPETVITQKNRTFDLLIVDTDKTFSKADVEFLNEYELNGGILYSLVDLFSYLDESMPAEIIKNHHYEYFSSYKLNSFYNKYSKRVFDILVSIFFMVLFLPLMIFVYLFIAVFYRVNPIYTQIRTGLNQKEFKLYKFITMKPDSEKDGVKLTEKNDNRITLIGRIMRPFRIDELPQIFNIIKGDMSFIGPRPERPELIKEIIKSVPLFKKRILVKPGLTGWAQVKYTYVNNVNDMSNKLRYDLYYIRNLSAGLDFKILLYTFETVIFRRGAL